MQRKRFKPLIDKLFWIISIPLCVLMTAFTVFATILQPSLLFFMLTVDAFVAYFLISPLWGYVELREHTVFIKYGFFLKKEIAYDKIRTAEKTRKFYSESMMTLKNAIEHVNIKYNTFDVTTVSVVTNDDFIRELEARRNNI